MAINVWRELKFSFSGFDARNTYALALITLGYFWAKLSEHLIVALAEPVSRDIGFGDYACYERKDFKYSYSEICSQYKSNKL